MKLDPQKKAALVIAHPGHELRVYGWLEEARPVVFVLTDGSGSSGRSRLDRTETIVSRAGAKAGVIFGRFTDTAVYSAILKKRVDVFCSLAEELRVQLIRFNIDYVVGDAAEGYNPAHDLCRMIIDAAVRGCQRSGNPAIGSFDFPLLGRPDEASPSTRAHAIQIELDEAQFQRKLSIARSYAELKEEIEMAAERTGLSSFRRECLWPVCESKPERDFVEPPFYERYGEKQVAAGVYRQVLRYREHMRPLAVALRRHGT